MVQASSRRIAPPAEHTIPVEHGVTRELFLIALVVALGVLASVAIVIPALVSH
ncbi:MULTISPECIES: hypothetical protein [Nocardiaceae]|jgi:hypothetical protein|uniref:hypothetical protein n=1 Tax=Nocardiaceae TaxID=85025 RepID=UPI000ADB7692|nr:MULTISPECIES: hypothetical protein [Rhodococcus]